MNIHQALNLDRELLKHSAESKLSIEVILAFVLRKNREYLFAHPEEKIGRKEREVFAGFLQRLRNREPVAYITNQKEFFGLSFYVDERVLIPRPESEFLVEKILELIDSDERLSHKTVKICDVGTGSGNIAISLAVNRKNVDVTALDIDDGAVEVARINLEKNKIKGGVEILKSDLLEACKDERFDIVVANLPYIGTKKNNYISSETDLYEPHVALYGGDDGLELYRSLFEQICNLKDYPYYIMGEIGFSHSERIKNIAKKYFSEGEILVCKDAAGLDRYFIVKVC